VCSCPSSWPSSSLWWPSRLPHVPAVDSKPHAGAHGDQRWALFLCTLSTSARPGDFPESMLHLGAALTHVLHGAGGLFVLLSTQSLPLPLGTTWHGGFFLPASPPHCEPHQKPRLLPLRGLGPQHGPGPGVWLTCLSRGQGFVGAKGKIHTT
jgi:hypothetical protein